MNRLAGTLNALVSLVLVGVVSALPAVSAALPLTLDGVGRDTTCHHFGEDRVNCYAQQLTTEHGDDLIVLMIKCGFGLCGNDVSTIIDSSGLTFIQRVAYSPNSRLWEYYAKARFPLNGDNITVVFSCFCGIGQIQAFAIHGPSSRLTFDPSPLLPNTVSCEQTPSCSSSIKTSRVDFVVALTAINDAPRCGELEDGPPGFTIIGNGGGLMEVDYAIVAPQTSIEFVCNDNGYATALIIDAFSFSGPFDKVTQ